MMQATTRLWANVGQSLMFFCFAIIYTPHMLNKLSKEIA